MGDTTVVKVESDRSPHGDMGQRYLASGVAVAMRLWNESPGTDKPSTSRDYETVGLVIAGKAILHLEGDQQVELNAGDSWLVPRGAEHRYEIVEGFEAIEATSPPAHAHGRDAVQ